MKLFLAMVVCMMLLAPVTNAEAAFESNPFQIEAGVFEVIEPVAGEPVIFRGIFTGEDLYEMLVSQLNRLVKNSDKDRYPLIVLPIDALPEELWLELETEVKNRQGLMMDFICYDEAEAGEKPEMVEAFAFSLPLE